MKKPPNRVVIDGLRVEIEKLEISSKDRVELINLINRLTKLVQYGALTLDVEKKLGLVKVLVDVIKKINLNP